MIKIKLNKNQGELVSVNNNFQLDPKVKYVINMIDEIDEVGAQQAAIQMFGLPALESYYDWLESNGFDSNQPAPTNESVEKCYGNKPLWSTKLSQGVVMKGEDGDFYIIMECSREIKGLKYSQIILTPGGCM